MNPETIAVKILHANKFCILGTASAEAEPWVTPVAYRIDDTCNFYWVSERSTKHSGLIADNPAMSLCIIDQEHVKDVQYPDGRSHARALYFSGKGREIPYDELPNLLHWRYPEGKHKPEDFNPATQSRAIYQMTTTHAWYLGDPQIQGDLPLDQRQELDLSSLQKLL